MGGQPRVSITVVTGLVEAIRAAGGDEQKILETLNLDPALLIQREGFLVCADFARLLEEAARATGDPCFGLHFGAKRNPKELGPLVYTVLNAPTVLSACETAARYLHLQNESVKLSLKSDRDLTYLCYDYVNLRLKEPRQYNEYGMAVTLGTLRIMAGSQWAPREVRMSHDAPGDTHEHLRVFRAPVLFGCGENALVMEREFVDKPIPSADHRLYGILKRYLEEGLSHLPAEDSFVAAARKVIAEAMREGSPTLTGAAKKLAVSPRTLQRRLENYGFDFKRLLDDTRRQFASGYLKDSSTSLTEIAFLLGYSEVSAFNRAFKRWTGSTPMEYRRREI